MAEEVNNQNQQQVEQNVSEDIEKIFSEEDNSGEESYELINDDEIDGYSEDDDSDIEEQDASPEVDDWEGGIINDDGEVEEEDNEANTTPEPSAETEATVNEQPQEEIQNDDIRKQIAKAVAEKLEAEDIPNTKEFRNAVIREAKEEVCKELEAEEYNSFDEEHQALFLEKLENIRARKNSKFKGVVDGVTNSFVARANQERIQKQIQEICDTPEKMKELDKALGGVSYNAFNEMQEEIKKGKADKLLGFAKNLFSKRNNVNKKPVHGLKTRRGDRGFASDIVFGGY